MVVAIATFGNDIEMGWESFTGMFAVGGIMVYVPRIRLGQLRLAPSREAWSGSGCLF